MSNRDNANTRELADRLLGKNSRFNEPCEYHFIAYRNSTGLVNLRRDKTGWYFDCGKNLLSVLVDNPGSFPNVLVCQDLDSKYALELQSIVEKRFDKERIALFMGEDDNWKFDRWAVIYPRLRLHSANDDPKRLEDYKREWREFEEAGTDIANFYPADVGGFNFENWMMHLCRTFPNQILLCAITDMVNGNPNKDRKFPANLRPGTGYIRLLNLRKLSARAILGDIQPLATAPEDSARDAEKDEGGKPKKGRPIASPVDDDRELLNSWEQAKNAGIERKVFCRDRRITIKSLTQAQGRQRSRNNSMSR